MKIRRGIGGRARRGAAAAVLLLAAVVMQGCSAMPDWANPVKWYDDAFGSEESSPPPVATDQTPPPEKAEAKPGFPNLASVPARPEEDTAGQRRAVQQSLAADRDSAQYTDEDLRGRPASAAATPPVPPPAATAVAAAAPTPTPAAPPPSAATASASATPVTTAALPPPPAPAAPIQQAALAPPPAAPARPSTPSAATQAPLTPAAVEQPAPAHLATSVDEVYRQALQQSAATVTTAPANANFVAPRGQPVSQFSTAVPPVVQQNYNASLATMPPALPVSGMPAGATRAAFAAAGSRLAATILFGDGSASLTAEDRATLRSIVTTSKDSGGTVRIVGYASGQGGLQTVQQKLATFDIAERRAEAVASELVRLGARANAVFVEAVTDADAGFGGAPEDSRRAEIFLEN